MTVKPPEKPALPEPAPKPTEQSKPQDKPPADRKRKPQGDHRLPASTKLEPDEMAKLRRIARKIGPMGANLSAALRFLVIRFDESTL